MSKSEQLEHPELACEYGEYAMVTKDMVRNAYQQGIAKLITNPQGNGVVCQIGEYWFYFGGWKAEDVSVSDYIEKTAEADIVESIYCAIWDIGMDLDEDEYNYYLAIFEENHC